MGTLLIVTLAAQLVLFVFTAISFFIPRHRVWPPPSRGSWQVYATWFLSWVSLSGVFLLAVFDSNSMPLPIALRLGAGVPLLAIGVGILGWAFRELSIQTTLGVRGPLVQGGPYQWSRNPQYVGTCIYLTSLVFLSGSWFTAVGCLSIGLWFLASPLVEEPWLAEQFGAEYEEYRSTVSRFFGVRRPRATAFHEDGPARPSSS